MTGETFYLSSDAPSLTDFVERVGRVAYDQRVVDPGSLTTDQRADLLALIASGAPEHGMEFEDTREILNWISDTALRAQLLDGLLAGDWAVRWLDGEACWHEIEKHDD
jgi:hypothetical protein